MYGSAILDFSLAQAIERYPGSKKLFVGLSLTANLGMLAYFKYANFFLDNVRDVMAAMGWPGDLASLAQSLASVLVSRATLDRMRCAPKEPSVDPVPPTQPWGP